MEQKVMIALIGEQPIPNLLPVRYEKPDRVALVYTNKTEKGFERLKNLLGDDYVDPLKIKSPYDIFEIKQDLANFINENRFKSSDIIFNLTGGTKPMAFASYHMAEDLSCPFIYLQSEGGKSIIFRYEFLEGRIQLISKDSIPNLLIIDDYLKAYLNSYSRTSNDNPFEGLVYDALCNSVDECVRSITHGNLEIDLVMQCGNQVGIAEVKSGKKALKKEGIDQLNTAAEQRYLGTYTRKFLILDREIGSENRELAEAHRIRIIELKSGEKCALSQEDQNKLIKVIRKDLGAIV